MHFAAVGAAALLEQNGEMPSLRFSFRLVLGKIEKGLHEPGLDMEAVIVELCGAYPEAARRKQQWCGCGHPGEGPSRHRNG